MKTKRQRNLGQFYTPTLFVDYAHDMISKEFGEDWKEKYVVWDNSAGSKRLTRDYYFNELYSSTLEQAELDISKHYNKEAVSFQFDFLNDPLTKLPKGLLEAFEQNKPIIFFMNPPYATAASGKDRQSKTGVSKTKVYEEMINDCGRCSQNLYAQFIYRIMMIKRKYTLTNCHICMFTPTLYLTGSSWKDFRKEFFKDFNYTDGCTFKASHFANVADNWGIAFSIWKNDANTFETFRHNLIDVDDNQEIVTIGERFIYNVDRNTPASDWVREGLKGVEKELRPHLSNAINISEKENQTLAKKALGSLMALSNNIDENTQGVAMASSIQTKGSACISISVLPDNFTRCTSLFSARKLVEKTWINSKDEYMKPNVEHEKWQEFENDSIIYSLFNTSSNQSSLRNVEYKDKKWDIKNEFFFMSREEMISLANENNNDYCYNDANTSNDRYVYNLLQGITLSDEAQAVLDKARELVRKTFKYRKLFNEEHENYQINNWDASYYQMKPLWKEYAKEDFEEFKELYKKLADKMKPMVYELGFLKR